ncbi:MAG: 5'-methylthioadenosine/adenosylhomocysteine nucleosidase [Candidatus Vecturithrix sp.]|jgi:adenosylhomocysteine nucleosidase|nr:5'-methylthioadenosine/adenosylhomocysteine nucleosidase [Candidatus Vecturithrix sp.]
MKIGMIAAMAEELELLKRRLEAEYVTAYGPLHYYIGRLCGHEVALLLCGIGKVNAAVGATLLIEKFHPDAVINTGVAGGFPPDLLHIGDIVVSKEVRHHDADATIFQYEYGQIPRMPAAYFPDNTLIALACDSLPEQAQVNIHQGQIISGDSFIHQHKQITAIREKFPEVMAVEMEGAAIAQTCYLFQTPFVIIRSISDLVTAEASPAMYHACMTTAAQNSADLVLNMLTRLPA